MVQEGSLLLLTSGALEREEVRNRALTWGGNVAVLRAAHDRLPPESRNWIHFECASPDDLVPRLLGDVLVRIPQVIQQLSQQLLVVGPGGEFPTERGAERSAVLQYTISNDRFAMLNLGPRFVQDPLLVDFFIIASDLDVDSATFVGLLQAAFNGEQSG